MVTPNTNIKPVSKSTMPSEFAATTPITQNPDGSLANTSTPLDSSGVKALNNPLTATSTDLIQLLETFLAELQSKIPTSSCMPPQALSSDQVNDSQGTTDSSPSSSGGALPTGPGIDTGDGFHIQVNGNKNVIITAPGETGTPAAGDAKGSSSDQSCCCCCCCAKSNEGPSQSNQTQDAPQATSGNHTVESTMSERKYLLDGKDLVVVNAKDSGGAGTVTIFKSNGTEEKYNATTGEKIASLTGTQAQQDRQGFQDDGVKTEGVDKQGNVD